MQQHLLATRPRWRRLTRSTLVSPSGFGKRPHGPKRGWRSYIATQTPTGGLVRPVLLAGATHDDRRYVEEAFHLSNDPHSPVRPDALWTLARIVPSDNECLLTRTIDRLHEIIDAPEAEEDPAIVVEAALGLLDRTDGGIVNAVEPLLEEASRNKAPSTRHALATGLLHHRRHYSEAMIEATFAALRHTS